MGAEMTLKGLCSVPKHNLQQHRTLRQNARGGTAIVTGTAVRAVGGRLCIDRFNGHVFSQGQETISVLVEMAPA